MITAGVDLDISPFTLSEWDKLSDNFAESLEGLFTDSKDFSHQIPVCYLRDPKDPKTGIPVKQDIHTVLSCLDRVRFQESMNLTEALNTLKGKGIKLSTIQSIQNIFDKFEEALGILPELPKNVDKRARDTRHRLELRRKRRVQTKNKIKQEKLKLDRLKIDKELAKKSKAIVKNAKAAQLTQDEMTTSHKAELQSTIDRLKSEAHGSRFEPEPSIDKQNILFEPTPKQAEFLAAPETVVFYGGAAGGGCLINQLLTLGLY